jgi:hypothetical protein
VRPAARDEMLLNEAALRDEQPGRRLRGGIGTSLG